MTEETVQELRFWLLIIATCLGAADLSLSKARRSGLREALSDWWLRLEYKPVVELLAHGAETLGGAYRKALGRRTFGPRFGLLAMLWGAAIAAVVAFFSFRQTVLSSANVWAAFANMAVPSAVLSWCSLAITLNLLVKMGSSSSLKRMTALTIVDLMLALAIACVLAKSTVVAEEMTGLRVALTPGDLVVDNAVAGPDEIATTLIVHGMDGDSASVDIPVRDVPQLLFLMSDLPQRLAAISSVFASLLVAFLDILPHLFISGAVLFAKWLRPVWKPIASWILLRLEDFPRGAIAALAAAVAVLTELLTRFAEAYLF